MWSYIFLVLSVILLSTAHYFKMLRWKQFIEIYEPPEEKNLIISLAAGYTVSLFLPFKIPGDVLRACISGRKMKNGTAFSLSTVVLDRYLDVLAISIIYIFFVIWGYRENRIVWDTVAYIILSIFLILLATITIKHSRIPKIILQKMSSIFNDRIEYRFLLFFWSFISSFRDMSKKINKKRLLGLTVIMWILYIGSYYFLAYSVAKILEIRIKLPDIFTILFSLTSTRIPYMINKNIRLTGMVSFSLILGIYLILSVLILYIISIFMTKDEKNIRLPGKINLLPHIGEEDKLSFLKLYFSGDNREYMSNYLSINRDISIIKDYSAGSNATTILCKDSGQTFFRKYSFGSDAKKLNEQIEWIEAQSKNIRLPGIIGKKYYKNCCVYDMPYRENAIGLFDFAHILPVNPVWGVIERVLDSLCDKLYTENVIKLNENSLKMYIKTKVEKNIKKIEEAVQLKPLLEYDTININGVNYKNLSCFEDELSGDNLYTIFQKDVYSNIHGDLTIENIICEINSSEEYDFYIIDPNTGNIHDSPNLDFGKLLQSLHGNYEFLMRTQEVNVKGNQITYPDLSSEAYHRVYEKYKNYLSKKFDRETNKSIFYHEIIHWLRLMPYKIEKNGKRAVIFYAGMIKVINDAVEMFKE